MIDFCRSLTSKEFIIPLSNLLKKNKVLRSSRQEQMFTSTTYIPAMEQFLAVRPKLVKEEE